MVEIDEIDRKIISILRENARASFVEIASKIGVSEGTIRFRVKKLLENKIIKKFTIETEDVKAIVLVNTKTNIFTTSVANEIRNLGIDTVYEVSGSFDIVCFIRTDKISQVDEIIEKIRSIKGVVSTQTLMVLK